MAVYVQRFIFSSCQHSDDTISPNGAEEICDHDADILPEPVGPIRSTLLFSSSTFSSSSIFSGIPVSAPDLA